MTEIIFRCEMPDVLVRLYDFRPIPSDSYECMSFGLEIRTQAFRVQKRMQGFLLELDRLSTDIVALLEGIADSLRLTFLGEFFGLQLNKCNATDFILTCWVTCYEGQRETELDISGSFEKDKLMTIRQQIKDVLKELRLAY